MSDPNGPRASPAPDRGGGAASPVTRGLTLELFVLDGVERGRRFVFRAPVRVTLGRSSSCQVPLNDLKISRRHCEIDVAPDACTIRDLGSANGTRVNGVRIEAGALEDGDRVRIGDSEVECAVARDIAASGEEMADAASSTRSPPLAGYRFLEKIGQGNNGVIYKAEQLALGRIVAVKVLPIARGKDPRDVARFIRGAKAEALLVHPNIVQVFDFVRSRDVHVVMEYVEGEDLRKRTLRLGRLPVKEAVGYALQVLAGLQHAYERRIVHRDVKPENVIVDRSGVAKLTDFGLAKSFVDTGLSGITSPDEGAGTPAYMPPEQLRSALRVDQRADIYSAGATLYHTLAGVPPFSGSVAEVIRRIEREPPRPLGELAEVPPALAAAVGKAMARDPAQRFATPREFGDAIAAFR